MVSALDLSLQGFDPDRATQIAAIEDGETDGCTEPGERPDQLDDGIISADELAELDAPE